VKDNDNKFDYDNEGIVNRKYIKAYQIRYIDKESNSLDDNLNGLECPDYLELTDDRETLKNKEFEKLNFIIKAQRCHG